MITIRIHGRGGQGAVTGAELIALAAFHNGQYAQAFPFFGVERQGAPVEAYCRINDKKITLRSQVRNPDYLIIQDASLLANPQTFAGVQPPTTIIINSQKEITQLKLPKNFKYKTIPATKIALDCLGKPIINTALLGAFAGATKIISLESLKKAIREKFAEKGQELVDKNIKAAQKAYNSVQ
jgi:pyruvate ferredoxin oxidoreductase gamma subunit